MLNGALGALPKKEKLKVLGANFILNTGILEKFNNGLDEFTKFLNEIPTENLKSVVDLLFTAVQLTAEFYIVSKALVLFESLSVLARSL